jgi:hypothetical protein
MSEFIAYGHKDKKDNYETIATAKTLTASDSGKVFLLNAAAGVVIGLPLVNGFKARFVTAAAFASTDFTLVSATSVINGNILVAGAHVAALAENTISFVASAESLGDFVDISCDGTNIYVSGSGVTTGSITATDA